MRFIGQIPSSSYQGGDKQHIEGMADFDTSNERHQEHKAEHDARENDRSDKLVVPSHTPVEILKHLEEE